mmetsp:Transcript_69427/g.224524  ORF Transcript_69427/g.224524 Transcript_69427/m.224524 type:complete len:296 (+) Transcript_69427:731-1618(+)
MLADTVRWRGLVLLLDAHADEHDANDGKDVGDKEDHDGGPDEHAHGLREAPEQQPDLVEELHARDDAHEPHEAQRAQQRQGLQRRAVRRPHVRQHPDCKDPREDHEERVEQGVERAAEPRHEAAPAEGQEPQRELHDEDGREDVLRDGDEAPPGLGAAEQQLRLDAHGGAVAEDHQAHRDLEGVRPHDGRDAGEAARPRRGGGPRARAAVAGQRRALPAEPHGFLVGALRPRHAAPAGRTVPKQIREPALVATLCRRRRLLGRPGGKGAAGACWAERVHVHPGTGCGAAGPAADW